jgi:hypothetical protein
MRRYTCDVLETGASLRNRAAHGQRRPVAHGAEGTRKNVGSQPNGTLSA